nr:ABC transporter permease [Actinomycetota bacterium]
HSLATVRQFADRVLLLERGRMIQLGEPDAVIEEYERRNREREGAMGLRREGSNGHEVVDAWVETEGGTRTSVLHRGEQGRFRFIVRLDNDAVRPDLGFAVRDAEGRVLLSETDRWRTRRRGVVRAGEFETFSAPFPVRLEPGDYEATALLAAPDDEGAIEPPGSRVSLRVEDAGAGIARRLGERAAEGEDGTAWWARARRFADVSLALATAEFKLRYLDSLIGYAWALAQPLLMFAVLYTIWTKIFHVGHVGHYPLKLLVGVALFTFFSEASAHALPSLVTKGEMLKKVRFPPLALPLSSVLTSALVYGLSLAIVVVFILVSGITPTLAWLEAIPLLLLLAAFTFGAAMVLSLLYVSIRDVMQIWVVVARLLLFLTPVFYPVELAPHGLRHVLMLNPLAVVIEQLRHALIDPSAPTAAAAAGGAGWVAGSVAFTVALVAAGLLLFRTWGKRLAERI